MRAKLQQEERPTGTRGGCVEGRCFSRTGGCRHTVLGGDAGRSHIVQGQLIGRQHGGVKTQVWIWKGIPETDGLMEAGRRQEDCFPGKTGLLSAIPLRDRAVHLPAMLAAVAEHEAGSPEQSSRQPCSPMQALKPTAKGGHGACPPLTLLLQFLKHSDTEEKLFSLTHLKRESGLWALRPRVGHDRDLHTINFCEFYSPQWSDIKQAHGGATVTGGFSGQPCTGLWEREEAKAGDTLVFRLLGITFRIRGHNCWPGDPNPTHLPFCGDLRLLEGRSLSFTVGKSRVGGRVIDGSDIPRRCLRDGGSTRKGTCRLTSDQLRAQSRLRAGPSLLLADPGYQPLPSLPQFPVFPASSSSPSAEKGLLSWGP